MTPTESGAASASGFRLPVPTPRALTLLSLGLVPALFSGAIPSLLGVVVGWNLLVATLLAIDLWRAPSAEGLRVTRTLPKPLRVGVEETVHLTLLGPARLRGWIRDTPPPTLESRGHLQPVHLGRGPRTFTYAVQAERSGALSFGDVHLRLSGPLGLMQRQVRVGRTETAQARADVPALAAEALHLVHAQASEARRRRSALAQGHTFHSLREYRPGEDARAIDWKATARRAEPVVRVRRPEQHQPILLMLDCGRHMAGRSGGRRRLDLAVEAALRVAAASLFAGDRVGLVAYAGKVLVHVAPRAGRAHLQVLAESMVGLDASYEEADHGRALETALARNHRRSLIVFFTDLLDAESARPLLEHLRRLGHRHLPLIAALQDRPLRELALQPPGDITATYERHAASRLTRELEETLQQVRRTGAHLLHAPAETFGVGSVNAYLELKARGAL